jgi:hypothetical protein
MGTRAHGAQHNLCVPNGDQVPSPSGFCSRMDQDSAPPVAQEHWTMYFDGSFTLNGTRGGKVLISPKGD